MKKESNRKAGSDMCPRRKREREQTGCAAISPSLPTFTGASAENIEAFWANRQGKNCKL